MRKIMDYNLKDRVTADKTAMEEELEKYISEESFESWYKEFCEALSQVQSK